MTDFPLSGTRLLILEDEFLIAMDLEHLARDHGVEDVLICRAVAEAGTHDGAYDVAILDVMLGIDTTLDFARRLAAGGVPFIFATGYTDNPAILGEFAEVPIIPKPYTSSQVISALLRALGQA